MVDNDTTSKPCPVCDEPYVTGQPTCLFCRIELNSSQPLELGYPTTEQEEASKQVLLKGRGEYFQAALRLSWRSGSFSLDLFQNLTGGRYADELKGQAASFETEYRNGFLRGARDDRSLLQRGIHDLVMTPLKEMYLLDDGPDQLTLVRVTNKNDRLTFQHKTIEWEGLEKDWPESRRSLALVGGYYQPDIQILGNQIRSGFTSLGGPSTFPLLLCSRMQGGKHSQAVRAVVSSLGCPIHPVGYVIGGSVDFTSYLDSKLKIAPLCQDLVLLTAQVAQGGVVTLRHVPLFPAGIFFDPSSQKKVVVKSLHAEGGPLDLVVLRQERTKPEPSLYQAWKAELAYGADTTLTFSLEDRTKLSVNGIQANPAFPNIAELLRRIPARIAPSTSRLDLALVIETIAEKELLQERLALAEEIINVLIKRENALDLRVTLIPYGDHYMLGGNIPQDMPPPCWKTDWILPDELRSCISEVKPTPNQYCDFESALDMGLELLNRLDWREDVNKWVLTFGKFKPHPKVKEPFCSQAPSPGGKDWVRLVNSLKEKQVNSLVVVSPLEWKREALLKDWHQVPKLTDAFWRAFGYKGYFRHDEVSPEHIVEMIVEHARNPGAVLSLPVIG